MRFAWWGAEEAGLIGSTAYVNDLSAAERDQIALYLNFDMVGSPNYIFMVYDADESTFEAPVPIPPGSTAIEDVFESFYTLRNEPYDDSEFSGRSDYQAFIENGIPAGGLFTGAEEIKTAEQAAIWGGTAGAQFDPCYHEACDTFANNNNARARRERRFDRVQRADLRVLDRDGERRRGQARAGLVHDPGAGWAAGDLHSVAFTKPTPGGEDNLAAWSAFHLASPRARAGSRLPVEHVLATHGGPFDRAAFERALS